MDGPDELRLLYFAAVLLAEPGRSPGFGQRPTRSATLAGRVVVGDATSRDRGLREGSAWQIWSAAA